MAFYQARSAIFLQTLEFELFIEGLNPNPTELGERIIKMNIGACSECSWIIHFTGHRPWIHPVFLSICLI